MRLLSALFRLGGFEPRSGTPRSLLEHVGDAVEEKPNLGLSLAGVTLAAGSTMFAGYMIATRPDSLMIKPMVPQATLDWHQGTGVLQQYDYTPVGGIIQPAPNSVRDLGRDQKSASSIPYKLRSAVPGAAVVEGPEGRVTQVTPGSLLPNAGRVISIERRPNGWVVVTTLRTID
jgi:hypothetical protein